MSSPSALVAAPSARGATARAAALALVAAVSTLDVPALWWKRGRTGFLLGGAALALALAVALLTDARRRAARLPAGVSAGLPASLPAALRRQAPLVAAAAALVGAALLSAAGAHDRGAALLYAVRIGAVLGYLTLIEIEIDAAGAPELRRALAVAAAAVILLWLGTALAGVLSGPASSRFFMHDVHVYAGAWPRFTGPAAGPFLSGLTMLVAAGLVRRLPGTRVRAAFTTAALCLAAASLSFATLLVPVAGCAALWRRRPRLRRLATTLAALTAIFLLHFQILRVRVAGATWAVSRPHPAWARGGLGPALMPPQALGGPALGLDVQPTNYLDVAVASVACFTRHPLWGVGGRNHEPSCPVETMNTYGTWLSQATAHNEILGQLAERGLVGCAATLALILVLRRRTAWTDTDPWVSGLAVAALLGAMAGDVFYQFPVAALLGSSLTPRARSTTAPPPA